MPPIQTGLCLEGTEEVARVDAVDSVMGDGIGNGLIDSDADEDAAENHQASATPRKVHFVAAATAASPKKPNAQADVRIKTLKQQGYGDKYVATKLGEEGFINYAEKTVTGRWRKIRQALEKVEAEELDDNLSDWHEGDDDLLEEAHNNADKKFQQELQRLEQQKWKTISSALGATMGKKKYTAKACKERFGAVQDGTAEVPFEQDSDPEGRVMRRDQRIADNKRRRAAAKDAVRRAEADKLKKIEDEKERKLQVKLGTIKERQAKMEQQREENRMKEERRLGKEAERRHRKEAERRAREEVLAKRRIKNKEESIFKYYTGRDLTRRHNDKPRNKADAEKEDGVVYLYDSDDAGASSAEDVPTTTPVPKEKIAAPKDKIAKRRHDSMIPDNTPPQVTEATLTNHRSILTMEELVAVLHERGLPRRGQDELHPEIIARLAAADRALDTTDLNNLLAKHFESQKGSMAKRVARLQLADALASAAGDNGVRTTDSAFKDSYEGYTGKYAHLKDIDTMEKKRNGEVRM